MADQEAQFNEVLSIAIPLAPFVESLSAIRAEWDKFLAGLGGAEILATVGADAFVGIKEAVVDLKATLADLFGTTVEDAEAATFAQFKELEKQNAAQEAAALAQRERAVATAQVEIDAAAQVTASLNDQAALIAAKRELADDLVKTTPAQRFGQVIDIEQEGVQGSRIRNYEEEMAAIQEKANLENAAFDAAATKEEQRLLMTRTRVGEEIEAIQVKANLENAAFDAAVAHDEQRLLMTRIRAGEEMAAIQERANAENAAFDKRAANPIGAGGKGVENFFTVENISRLAQFVVIWKLLSEVINGVVKALESPFKALESGVEYLRELEAKADELTGVLDANVRFSDDLAENFKRAAEVAPVVVKALQDAAIAAHLNPDQLTNIFKALANNGATAGVGDLQQLVQLATMYGMALKASGASAQSVQRAVMEIPKAMEGTLPPTSKWLQVLGLTNDQWVSLRDQGLKYHDLVDRIGNLPSMQAHIAALQQMEGHQKSVVESMELMLKRAEAAGAQPIYDAINKALAVLSEWFKDNQDSISNGLKMFSNLLIDVAHNLALLGSSSTVLDPLILAFSMLGSVVNIVNEHVGILALGVHSLEERGRLMGEQRARQAALAQDVLDKKGTPEQRAKDQAAYNADFGDTSPTNKFDLLLKEENRKEDEIHARAARLRDLLSGNKSLSQAVMEEQWGEGGVTSGQSDSRSAHRLNTPVTSKTPPPPGTVTPAKDYRKDFDVAKQDFSAHAEEIAATEKYLSNATQEAVAARTLSHKDAAERIKGYVATEIDSLQQEKKVVDARYEQDKAKIAGAPGVTGPEQLKKKEASDSLEADHQAFNARYTKLVDSLNESVSASQRAANNEGYEIRRDHFKAVIALQEDAVKKELALTKFQAENGYLTQLEAFDKETALVKEQRQIKIRDDAEALSQLGPGTAERAKLQGQMDRATGQFAEQTSLRSQERIALIETERTAAVEYADKLRATQLEAASQQASIAAVVSPGSVNAGEAQMFAARERELEILIREKQQLLENAQARNAESVETRKLAVELQNLYNQRLKDYSARLGQMNKLVPDQQLRGIVDAPILREGVEQAQRGVNDAAYKLDKFDRANPSMGGANAASVNPALVAQRAALVSALQSSEAALTAWNQAIAQSTVTWSQSIEQFLTKLVGFDPVAAWKQAKSDDSDKSSGQKGTGGGFTGYDAEIAVGAKTVAGAFKGIANAAVDFQQQWKEGGPLAAIGGVMSQIGSLIPGVGGAIVSAVGSIMSTIGSLFTAAAKAISDDIQKQVKDTMLAYSTKQADLVDTIAALQQEESSAISRLSGAKGGQDQLDKILPGIEQQIASLSQQATQTIADFGTMTNDLSLQNDTLSQVNKEWEQINQQVADYLSAGGNIATAQQALNATLQQMQTQSQNALNQANDTAVQDAINLNGLLEQRLQLTMQYNQQVFAVVNQGSIQRKAGAVTQGMQLEQLAAQYAQQMTTLNSQIDLAQQKVTLESKVFDIATNINDLHAQDAKLQVDALNQQILQWKALQEIVADISKTASGGFTVTPGLFNPLPSTINVELKLAGYTLTATGVVQPNGSVTTPSGPSLDDQLQQNLRNTLGI